MEKAIKNQTDDMFQEYPDVVNMKLLSEMLGGISIKSVYKLSNQNKIGHLKIGRPFLIPKYHIIQYLKNESNV